MSENKNKRPEWTKGRARGNWIIFAVLVVFVLGWYGYFLINTASRAAG
ncbi:MAG: hypothetical protein ACPG42_03910 [Alphaproteobacteria bacterium]|jgi:hypothetical protein